MWIEVEAVKTRARRSLTGSDAAAKVIGGPGYALTCNGGRGVKAIGDAAAHLTPDAVILEPLVRGLETERGKRVEEFRLVKVNNRLCKNIDSMCQQHHSEYHRYCEFFRCFQARYPACRLGGRRANVLVFPDLDASNAAVNLLRLLGDNPVVGPVMLGLEKPVHVLQPHSAGVSDVVHMTAIACMDAAPTIEPSTVEVSHA